MNLRALREFVLDLLPDALRHRIATRLTPAVGPDLGRCTGHCCSAFVIPSIRSMQDYRDFVDHDWVRYVDGDKVRAMLIPLGLRRVREVGSVDEVQQLHFGCVHFNALTRDCMAYKARPAMCRDYPSGYRLQRGAGCSFRGCTHPEATSRLRQIASVTKAVPEVGEPTDAPEARDE